jgi:hypothetical protein
VLPTAPFRAPLVVDAEVASSQSMCTGLEECSFAAPVSLSASLPAFGFLNELQSGFAESLIERVAELGSLSSDVDDRAADCEDFEPLAWALLELSAAIAGRVMPRAAARAIVLTNWLRIMDSSSVNRKSAAIAAAHEGCGIARPAWLRCLVRTESRVAKGPTGRRGVRPAGLPPLATSGLRPAIAIGAWSDRTSPL